MNEADRRARTAWWYELALSVDRFADTFDKDTRFERFMNRLLHSLADRCRWEGGQV